MKRKLIKVIFLWVGNISIWVYYGGDKKMEDVAKEDNEILGLIVTVILGFLIYFSSENNLFKKFFDIKKTIKNAKG